MSKVLVLYYSSYGHIERMAEAVSEGVRQAGAEAIIKRVPELVPEEVARKSNFKLDQKAPIATIAELPDYDAIIIGVPTRFGNMAAQMKNFLDQAGGLWAQGKLIGKVASVFTSSNTQHGGQESTILTTHVVLLHLGMIIVGLPYSFPGQMDMADITGGSPYGASTIAGAEARASRATTNSPARAFKAATSRTSRTSFVVLDARFFRNMVNDGGRPISQYAESPEKQQHGDWYPKQP